MKFLLPLLLLVFGFPGEQELWADDVPVAPVSLKQHGKWGSVYELSSRKLNLLVSPDAGGVVSMNYSGSEEWLVTPIGFNASEVRPEDTTREYRAWKTSEGRQVVMISNTYGPPLSLRIVHIIELSPEGDHFQQTTRMTGTGPGDHSLLTPALTLGLLSPEEHTRPRDGIVQLNYGTYATSWSVSWNVELPEENLENTVDVSGEPEKIVLVFSPSNPLLLPPQGWTLICSLKTTWMETDVKKSAGDDPE